MSDGRVSKLRRQHQHPDGNPDWAEHVLWYVTTAGLLVVDPADSAVIDRVRRAVRGATGDFYADAVARDVLTALGGDRDE